MKDLLGEFVLECASDSVNARKTGEMLKREGIAKVSVNGAEFLAWARPLAKDIFAFDGEVTTDEIRYWADQNGIKPHHPNCWGAIFAGKEWKCVGRRRSTWPSNHGRSIAIWRLRK